MTSPPIYDFVLACLRTKAIPQRQVAEESGVAFSTVAKIAQGVVVDPSVHTVQKLHDYFRRSGEFEVISARLDTVAARNESVSPSTV